MNGFPGQCQESRGQASDATQDSIHCAIALIENFFTFQFVY